MMRPGTPSHLRAAARLLAAGLRRKGEREGDGERAPVPARRVAVERGGIVVDGARLRRYLAAVRARGTAEARTPGDGEMLPPTCSALWETALALELLAEDGMPFPSAGLIHLGSDLVSLRPLRVGEPIRCRVELERTAPATRGVQLSLLCRNWNASGQLAQENRTELLVRMRTRGAPGGAGRARREARADDDGEVWREWSCWDLPADAGLRYARASGDFNPIHLWPWSARLLGFPRPILHGHCSLAMIAGELAPGGDFRKLEARFRAPLALPARVRLEVSGRDARRFRLIGEGGKDLVRGEILNS